MHAIASDCYRAMMRGVAGGRECLINLVAPRVSKSLIGEMAFWDCIRWSYARSAWAGRALPERKLFWNGCGQRLISRFLGASANAPNGAFLSKHLHSGSPPAIRVRKRVFAMCRNPNVIEIGGPLYPKELRSFTTRFLRRRFLQRHNARRFMPPPRDF